MRKSGVVPLPGLAAALRDALEPGMTIAVGDGVGRLGALVSGKTLGAVLTDVASEITGLRLVLGWLPAPIDDLRPTPFADVVSLMPGWGARPLLDGQGGRFIPIRLAATPAFLSTTIRPDVLITRVVKQAGKFHFGTEVSWQQHLVENKVPVLAILDPTSGSASAEPPLPPGGIQVVDQSAEGPHVFRAPTPAPVDEALADAVLQFIPAHSRVQYGPGKLGTALLQRTAVPFQIDTGLLSDAVVDLDCRGLLEGTPSASYLFGSEALYRWATNKPILRGLHYTHDVARLSGTGPFVAVNTAIEIDNWGQVNVEGIRGKVVGGVGGHPDFCAAGTLSHHGLSIIAVPSSYRGRSPLVRHLSRPASTPAYDVDVVVTESGHADLRRADWDERRRLLTQLFQS